METPRQRIAAFWRDYERYGGDADPAMGQSADNRWSLAFCLICHFGRFPWLMMHENEKTRSAGGGGWDPCLPEQGTPEYEMIEDVVLKAEKIIGEMPKPLDRRLCGYAHGHRVPSGLNLHWAIPLIMIDNAEELRAGLISKLKDATLESEKAA